ncbi:MAG: alginate export family protein [Planctomycetaceae bacterium]
MQHDRLLRGWGLAFAMLAAARTAAWSEEIPLPPINAVVEDAVPDSLPERNVESALIPSAEPSVPGPLSDSPPDLPEAALPVGGPEMGWSSLPAVPRAPKQKKGRPAFPPPKNLPPLGPYKPLFYNNDFSYKQDPKHERLLGEELKDIHLELFGTLWTISTGGEVRYRFLKEDNRLRKGPPTASDYNQWRWRHYLDLKGETFRVYGEILDAESFDNEAPHLPTDVNQLDIQNLFADWTFLEGDLGRHTLRIGRQELLYGNQRLVSPLDWANTRRNFQGGKYILSGDDYSFEGFLVHPVNTATGYTSLTDFDGALDKPERNIWFGGTYYSYTGWENTVLDLYWMVIDTNRTVRFHPDMQRHTVGSRWAHLEPVLDDGGEQARVWDFDVEGGVQAGVEQGTDVVSGFWTGIVGHTWKKPRWTPRVSGLFYYGSGTVNALGNNNTFYVMFPLGHAYWALSDNLSGQNLFDTALQFDLKPTRKFSTTAALHWFQLASSQDTAYNVAGAAIGKPGNGTQVGTALDLYGYYSFNPNFDIQMGYSWFWFGSYIERTVPRGDSTQLYMMTSLRY